jgi:hypothetical protein
MARKGTDLLAAKERRNKKVAIVGAVLLVAVLAFQVPRTMKMLNRQSAPSAEEAKAADEETRSPAATTPVVTLPPADSTPVPAESLDTGQLIAFTRFSRKDPFQPQIREDSGTGASGSTTARPGNKNHTKGKGKRPARGARKTKREVRLRPVPVRGDGQITIATTAVISINGKREKVTTGALFPASEKMFRLTSLGTVGAKIGIAGGSLVGGGKTVTLKRGKTLTLENTGSGARYKLRLLSIS